MPLFVDHNFPSTRGRTNHANCLQSQIQSWVFAWPVGESLSPPTRVHLTVLVQQWVITKTRHDEIATRDILEQHCLCLASRGKDTLISHLCLLEEAWCVIMSQGVCHLFWSHYRGRCVIRSPHLRFTHPQQALLSWDFSPPHQWELIGSSRSCSRKSRNCTFTESPAVALSPLLSVPTARRRAVGQRWQELPSAPPYTTHTHTPTTSISSLCHCLHLHAFICSLDKHTTGTDTHIHILAHTHRQGSQTLTDEWETVCALV